MLDRVPQLQILEEGQRGHRQGLLVVNAFVSVLPTLRPSDG